MSSSIARFYEPFITFSEVSNILDETFKTRSGGFSVPVEKYNQVLKPRMNLHDNPETNTMTATFELAGLTKDQVNIDIHQNRLTVSGETSECSEKNQDGYVIKERRSGKFSRTLVLPDRTETDAIKASMEDGILTVTFPKSSPGQEPQRISIS